MGVESVVPMEMEVATSAHSLAKEAAVPEVNPTPETDALPRPPFPDHLSGKLVQKFGGLFKFGLRKRSEDLFEDLVRGHLVLGQKGTAFRGKR